MKKSVFFLFLVACILNSCSNGGPTVDREVISWGKMTQRTYSDLPQEVVNSLKYTVLEAEQQGKDVLISIDAATLSSILR